MTTSRPRRWLLRVVVVLVVVAGLPYAVDRASVKPAAALVKLAFEQGPLVKPGPGFAAVRARVAVERDITIPVAGAPSAVLDVYTPKQATAKARPIVLWVHGGGFISGDRRQVADYTTMLADQGFTVASLEYSLAPGRRYPVPVRQGTAALTYLAANAARFGGDPARMAVGGDSAGAQIASELAAVQTNPALAVSLGLTASVHLKATVLFCGLYDMNTVGSTGFPALRTYLWSYTGDRDWMKYPPIGQLSTTGQVTAAYPATFLTVGDKDPFRSQARELEGVLKAHGVTVGDRYWSDAGLGHEYQFDFRTAAARTAFTDTVAFLREQLS
jgi:acetyl esterase/lipase